MDCDYVAIGKLLRDRGLLPAGGASMQSIKDWIRANPDQGRELMRENASYIFFKHLDWAGAGRCAQCSGDARTAPWRPIPGSCLWARRSISRLDRPEAYGLWVAQDTGGAIKGPNRFDTFWGSGAEATQTAGGMATNGVAYVLLPKGVAARAVAQP